LAFTNILSIYYLRQVISVVCLSLSLWLLKLGVMLGTSNQKNWLTFGGDPVPDTDSVSLFHFLAIAEYFITIAE